MLDVSVPLTSTVTATWLLDLHAWAGPLRGGRRLAGCALKRLGLTAVVAHPAPEGSHQV